MCEETATRISQRGCYKVEASAQGLVCGYCSENELEVTQLQLVSLASTRSAALRCVGRQPLGYKAETIHSAGMELGLVLWILQSIWSRREHDTARIVVNIQFVLLITKKRWKPALVVPGACLCQH